MVIILKKKKKKKKKKQQKTKQQQQLICEVYEHSFNVIINTEDKYCQDRDHISNKTSFIQIVLRWFVVWL